MPKVNGLLYLTDGLGNYPIFPPEYESVFIFPPVEETWFSDDMDYVPSWITKVQLTEDDILEQ